MAADTTVPGGLYLDADGVNYHDANGKPVSAADAKKLVADFKKSQEEPKVEVEPEVVTEEVALKDTGDKKKAVK